MSVAAVGRALYLLSLHRLERATSTAAVSRILPLLLQAGCSADNRALYISAVLYSSGLGVERQYKKVEPSDQSHHCREQIQNHINPKGKIQSLELFELVESSFICHRLIAVVFLFTESLLICIVTGLAPVFTGSAEGSETGSSASGLHASPRSSRIR